MRVYHKTMGVTITDYSSRVKEITQQKASLFLRTMCDEIITISTPKTPKKTGRLRMDILRQVLGLKGKVQWGKGYAARQETTQFRNYTTKGTGPHYAEGGVTEGVNRTALVAKKSGLI